MILISIYLTKVKFFKEKEKMNNFILILYLFFINYHILKYNFKKLKSKVKLKQFKTTKQIYPGYKSKQLYLVNIYITKHE